MNNIKILTLILIAFVAGVTAGLSFLRTEWIGYRIDFVTWWSIVSTILGMVFIMGNIAQYVASVKEKDLVQKEKEIHKSQVKVWQHYANGIENGLFILIYRGFTSIVDMKIAIEAMQRVANTLGTSLNEERLFTDEEIKIKQIEKESEQKKLLSRASSQDSQI